MVPWTRNLILVALATTLAADEPLDKDPLDTLVRDAVARHRHAAPALVVGIAQGDQRRTWGFGALSAGGSTPSHDTVYEVGSVSKAFTGMALAILAREGRVSEVDPVARHLPARAARDAGPVGAIRLVELATHGSGLPRLPPQFVPRDMTDPYADFDEGELYAALVRIAPSLAPTGRYEYSNLGAGLLGHLLARAAGVSYAELVRTRIALPLRLVDTAVVLDVAQEARLAPPHDRGGERSRRWRLAALAGAGGVHSTAHDLLLLVCAHWRPDGDALADALRSAARARLVVPGSPLAVGLGWHAMLDRGWTWHNGQTGGYHAFVGMDLTRRRGVVVLANASDERYTPLGFELLARLSGQ